MAFPAPVYAPANYSAAPSFVSEINREAWLREGTSPARFDSQYSQVGAKGQYSQVGAKGQGQASYVIVGLVLVGLLAVASRSSN